MRLKDDITIFKKSKYYDKIIKEIINKTNNIPVRFDLFIYTNSIKDN